jgi:small-conductance mechanosensitive channel
MDKILDWLKGIQEFPYIFGVILVVIYIILMKITYKVLNKIFIRIILKSRKGITNKLKGINLGNYELLDSRMQFKIVYFALKTIELLVYTIILVVTLPALFYLNPQTKKLVIQLWRYVYNPLKSLGIGFIEIIPNVITIVIIVVVMKYILKFLKYLMTEISQGKLRIKGFYPEWGSPTYNLTRFIIYLLTITIIAPYLPGAGSDAFRGISIFAGILISLGSSTYVGNAIAGFILTYMRSFQLGDRIKINDITGDVVGKTLLVTRIKTTKNERVTIPNAAILSGHIINYTYSASKYNLVLHTSITIGYDVDWRVVHKLLEKSASDIEEVLQVPKPFVLQKALNDFYVEYEVNAYTKSEKKIPVLMSQLHANIQDNFHGAGIEIMSPHYRVNRSNEDIAIPEKYLTDKEENK